MEEYSFSYPLLRKYNAALQREDLYPGPKQEKNAPQANDYSAQY
jgi:hypothetical protein